MKIEDQKSSNMTLATAVAEMGQTRGFEIALRNSALRSPLSQGAIERPHSRWTLRTWQGSVVVSIEHLMLADDGDCPMFRSLRRLGENHSERWSRSRIVDMEILSVPRNVQKMLEH